MNGSGEGPPRAGLQAGEQAYRQQLAQSSGPTAPSLVKSLPPTPSASAVVVALYEAPPYDLQVPALGIARLSINLVSSRVLGNVDGARVRRFDAGRHSLFLTPAQAQAHWRKDTASRHLNLYFDSSAFDSAALETTAMDLRQPLLNGHVPGLGALADELASELQQGAVLAAEAADSLSRLLLIRLARHAQRRKDAANPIHAALMQRLRDHIMSRLGDRIPVQDLAAIAGLSPNRFTQAFAAHTGQSPHRFVLALRLAEATQLLRHSNASLADIAARCGFANQQHMTYVMGQRMGTTPGRFRRDKGL
jgi:AraC family transcriptional regulator